MHHWTRAALWVALVTLPLSGWADAPPRLDYRFELVREPALAVRVHLRLQGSAEGVTTLEMSDAWGGADGGGEDMVGVTATGADGRALKMSRPAPHQVVVEHAPGASIEVTYAFPANDYQAQRDRSIFRRPIMNAHLFRTVGHLGLLRPLSIDQEAPCAVTLAWDGFEAAGWHVLSSWGAGEERRAFTASVTDLGEALYLAGDITVITRDIHGYPLTITVEGDQWGFTPEAFADACARVVGVERGFFNDYERDFYWISLVGTGLPLEDGYSIGGTGLRNCFSLSCAPNTKLRDADGSVGELVRILAHEMFHDWNGVTMRREQPEELMYWFSEGFTDFYARRLMYRGGLIDRERYASSASHTLELYATSPVRDEPNARVLKDFWNDRHVQKLPYYRGDIVAMILDENIRRVSGATRSLDDVMRELLEVSRSGVLLNVDNVMTAFAKYADEETVTSIRRIVTDGGMPHLPRDLFAPCLTLEPRDVYRFDLGFDFKESMEEKTVTGVRDGSAAAAAGLRDGMPLKGWSVHGDDINKEAVFQVLIDSVKTDIRYYPRGAPVPSYRLIPAGGADACDSL